MKSTFWTIGLAILIVAGYYLARHLYLSPKNITGEKAHEIQGQLLDGSDFALSQLKGQYVLLDFWGSWCGPCRESHPQLVSLHEQFKDQVFKDSEGFAIVSVAIEKNPDQWQRAIRNDRLNWPYHLMVTESFESSQARAYGVKQIPTKFLINPQGKIMAVDPSLAETAKLLESRLKKAS